MRYLINIALNGKFWGEVDLRGTGPQEVEAKLAMVRAAFPAADGYASDLYREDIIRELAIHDPAAGRAVRDFMIEVYDVNPSQGPNGSLVGILAYESLQGQWTATHDDGVTPASYSDLGVWGDQTGGLKARLLTCRTPRELLDAVQTRLQPLHSARLR